ncbi:MAG: GNAT family N-acetyltransferase [Lachnospiraceae bacterium]|nr:GNAT family N-acetyltransferase [Lachnospiraceae bacterium]
MQLTRIEKENEGAFAHLCPDEMLFNENLLRFGVIDDDEPACVCVTGACENMGAILWIYTDPEKRGRGIGTYMMEQVAGFAEENGLEGIMVDFYSRDNDLDDFLSDAGFLVSYDHNYYHVPISEIVYSREMDLLPDPLKSDAPVFTLADPYGQMIFKETIKNHGLDPRIFAKISPELCAIYENPKGKKISGIFLSELDDGDLYVNYMISDESLQGLITVIKFLRDIIVSKDITNGEFIFSDRVGKAVSFIESITELDRVEDMTIPDRMQAVKLFV